MSNVRSAGIASCLILFLTACGGDESASERPFSEDNPQDSAAPLMCAEPKPDSVSATFAVSCANCHGADGIGKDDIPSLQHAEFHSLQHFTQIVRFGTGTMPAFNNTAYPADDLDRDFAFFAHDTLCDDEAETPVTAAPDASYSFCVNEAEWLSGPQPDAAVCEFEGTRQVAFGANGQFFYTQATGSIDCTSTSFEGDPANNTRKACFFSDEAGSSSSASSSSSVAAPVAPEGVTPVAEGPGSDYTFCVNEAAWVPGRHDSTVCEFDGTREVAFGANGQFSYQLASGSIECSIDGFDGDPTPRVRKACFVANTISTAPSDSEPSAPPSESSSRSSSSVSSSAPANPEQSDGLACDTPKPAAPSSEFGEHCASCHGDQGLGNSLFPNLVEAEFESLRAFEHPVRDGAGAMPPFSENVYPLEAMRRDFAYFAHDAHCAGGASPIQVSGSCEVRDELLEPQLRRLTQSQLVNTVTAIFGDQFDPSIWPDLGDSNPTVGMSNNADMLQVNNVNFQRIHDTVSAIIEQLLSTTLSDCIESSSNRCIDNLLVEYAPQLWRRPLGDRELMELTDALSSLRASDANRSQQAEFVFRSLLMSPNFLFRMELGEVQNSATHLDSYEIASLLSYALWDGPPDETLYQLASTDQLIRQEVIDQQVDRMIEDPRFSGALVGFFKDFLKLDRVLTVEKRSGLEFTDSQRRDLLTSAEMMLARRVTDLDQDLMEIFHGNQFYVNNNIAPLFGLSSSDFDSEFRFTSLATEERSGILTHPAFLAVHATAGTSGIVKRGVFALEQMLCVHLGDPPDDLSETPLPPDVVPAITSSRVLLQLQHSQQPTCITCHQVIDPAGFGFENYDVLGQYRTVEKDIVTIDASGELDHVVSQPLVFRNSVEYVQGLVETPEMRSCVNRRMLESFSGQRISANACELEQLNQHIDQDDTSIRGLIRSLTQLESVRLRTQ